MGTRAVLITSLFLLTLSPSLAPPAHGQTDMSPPSTYVALRGSYAFSGNTAVTYAPTTPMTQLRGSYAGGGGGSIAIGTYLPLNLRLEIEGLYRYEPVSKVSLNGIDMAAGGHAQIGAPMMNILWDIPMPLEAEFQPFVGMGVGAAYSDMSAQGSGNVYLEQHRWDPAYSFITGVALAVDDQSRITAMYRWMQVRDASFKCAIAGTVESACLNNSFNKTSVDLGYELSL